MGDATLYTVLPTHTAEVGITLAQVGIMLGVNRAIRLLSNPAAGIAYDRIQRRWIFVPALFLGAISTAIYGLAGNFWLLLFGRLLWGISWSGIWVGGTTMILDVATDQNRGKWSGLYQIWFFTGTAIGALSGGVMTDVLGYYGTMWVCSAVTAIGAVFALLFLPETRPELSPDTRYKHNRQKPVTELPPAESSDHHKVRITQIWSSQNKQRFAFVVWL
ncbi:MAG: MFS transporter, partial [Anaerolineae bacterium]|nr:MFS transporter [Anaerolineae bacterium]